MSQQTTAGAVMNWDAKYECIEIYVAGPHLEALRTTFEEYEDNPQIVGLFRTDLFNSDGTYNGDGCSRLELRSDYLYAAIDGTSPEYFAKLLKGCLTCAEQNPDLSYMVVGTQAMIPNEEEDGEDDETAHCDVVFLRGFDAANNPMKREHGKFYAEYVMRGI